MSEMLGGPLSKYSWVLEASLIAVFFFVLFGLIFFLVFRPRAKPVFDRASRLPLEEK